MLDIEFDTKIEPAGPGRYAFNVRVAVPGAHTREWMCLFLSSAQPQFLKPVLGFESASWIAGNHIGEDKCHISICIRPDGEYPLPDYLTSAIIVAITETAKNYQTYKTFSMPIGNQLDELKRNIIEVQKACHTRSCLEIVSNMKKS